MKLSRFINTTKTIARQEPRRTSLKEAQEQVQGRHHIPSCSSMHPKLESALDHLQAENPSEYQKVKHWN